ncbi:sodium-coupled monocarboxylate transporter 2-like [Macrobrachium rosenbergii]|uniref:sodium-coupled monocarboxylate transporter 2-like n=1 Tax=Macrobrachium rosenbergii TaxID=79674 RepID=UPI0034D6D573
MDDSDAEAFGLVNWIVCVILLLASVVIGIFAALRGRGNNSTEEYLLGGRRMSSLPVALSLIASTISAISILGLSSEMYFYGTQFSLVLAGTLYGTFFTQAIVVPILYPLETVSVNEYISLRFGCHKLRKVASINLVANNLLYNGFCLYAPSLTLSTVTGLSSTYSIIIMGIICSFYISLGGVKAIVYTDVVQTILMFLGIVVTIVICVVDLGGLGNVFHIANEGERLQFFNFDPSPLVRYTFWSVQVQGVYNMISWIGISQMGYMRYSSVPSVTLAKRLCSYYFVGLCALWLIFFFAGIVAYATYSECDPLTSGRIDEPDQILPYLVVRKVSHSPGMAGLFAAAVYSGMLSSMSTYANSSASLIWQDLFREMKFFKGYSDAKATKTLKITSAAIGLSAIGFAMLVKHLGSIVVVTNSLLNAGSGSLTGIFVTGICAPWVSLKGAYAGFITALAFSLWLMIGQFIAGHGQTEKLPLSTEGCPENLYNWNSTSTVMTTVPSDEPYEEAAEKTIYDLSYCYTGMLGIVLNYIVSSLVSVFIGPPNPADVDARLISPSFLRLYTRLWIFFKGHNSLTAESVPDLDVFALSAPKRSEIPTEPKYTPISAR